jgi:pyruvate/2-oxoglutarate dehydrogenase complex dihydrolipoamide dehydrogenase (E3) component
MARSPKVGRSCSGSLSDVSNSFVIIGGGPAGNAAATHAARFGAAVTIVERDVIGGAAHLWDCIPSKTMIATGGAMSFTRRIGGMGLERQDAEVDIPALTERIEDIKGRLQRNTTRLLESQGVRMMSGTARLLDPHRIEVTSASGETEVLHADAVLLATGSRPRIPEWCRPDGERILTTRDCYPPKLFPKSMTVVGSGVTGVEFVHMFSSFGADVTLVVSRQQVLPSKDPEVAAVLEDDFLKRGVRLLKGARAIAIERVDDEVVVSCDDGRVVHSSHAVLAIGSVPNTDGLGLEEAGVQTEGGYVIINRHCQSNISHIYAAGDVSGKLPLSSVASMQGRKVAEHVMGLQKVAHRHLDYDKAASAIFTEPEIADVGLAETEAFAVGRKIRVTKVPFSATPKALINNDPRGFVKIVSDPATGVVLGGSIVGRHAAELISVIALAVTAHLKVSDIVESLLVHPALSEALAEAAD